MDTDTNITMVAGTEQFLFMAHMYTHGYSTLKNGLVLPLWRGEKIKDQSVVPVLQLSTMFLTLASSALTDVCSQGFQPFGSTFLSALKG